MKSNLLRLIAILSVALILGFSANPPDGRTGAPGDGLCSNCHSSSSQTGNVAIQGIPAIITPGQTYNLTVVSTTTSGSIRGGFQMVALHDDGNINAGSMSNPSTSSTVTTAGNGRTYHEHNPAQFFSGGDMVMYSVDWTAPLSGPNGDITFYAASVLANGNGSTSGDGVVTTNESGSYMAANPLVVNITVNSGVSCNMGNDGMATAAVSGGMMPYSYQWSSGETSQTAVMLSGGTQSITITEDGGSMITEMVNIPEPTSVSANIFIDNEPSCNGFDDGQMTANGLGGTPGYTYVWSDGQTTATAANLAAGMYTVTVTDDNGCTRIETQTLTEPDILSLTLVQTTDVSCNGFDDGSIAVTATGGNPDYFYIWSDGQNGPMANNLAPGDYSVTVSDVNGCSDVLMNLTISEPSALMGNAVVQSDVSCFGGSDGAAIATASGGTLPYSYLWSDGQMTELASNLSAGVYTCMITDGNGCTDMVTVNVTEPQPININLTVMDESSPGANDGSITSNVMGGTPDYQYLWSNGEMTESIFNLMPGDYSLTVTDDNNCMMVASATISGNGCTLTANIQVVDIIECSGDQTGTLTFSANEPVMDVTWSNGSTTDTIHDLSAGMYSVTITGIDNCQAFASINLQASDADAPSFVMDTICLYLDDSGMAVLDSALFFSNVVDNCDPLPSANFIPITVNCDDFELFTMDYILTDESGNSDTVTLFILPTDTIRPVIDCPLDITTNSCDAVVYDLPTFSDNCDSATLSLDQGLPSGDQFPVGTTEVVYTVTDKFGNPRSCSFSVTVMSDLNILLSTTDVTCADSTNGTISIIGIGGTPPYSIQSEPAVDFNNAPAGSYVITLIDSAGCVVEDTAVIDAPTPINLDSIDITDATSGNNDGDIDIDVSGGSLPYAFSWFLNDTVLISNEEDISDISSGYYTLIIVDANGCLFSMDSIFVDEISSTIERHKIESIKLISDGINLYGKPDLNFGNYSVEIFSLSGLRIMQESGIRGDFQYSLNSYSTGVYLVRVISEKGQVVKRKIFIEGH